MKSRSFAVTNREIESLANDYWVKVPAKSAFPRNLEHSVCWGYPVVILTLPDLTLAAVHSWLSERGILRDSIRRDRPLHACLAAIRGQGFIFLNGTDSEEQRRFSLAHEIAHFILDYNRPRKQAIEFFGQSIIDVLDGERPPSVEERLAGTLRSLNLGNFDHLIDRDEKGSVSSMRVLDAEDNADRLALELLAPRRDVVKLMKEYKQKSQTVCLHTTQTLLTERYGLPATVATQYARFLLAKLTPQLSFRDWLGE